MRIPAILFISVSVRRQALSQRKTVFFIKDITLSNQNGYNMVRESLFWEILSKKPSSYRVQNTIFYGI